MNFLIEMKEFIFMLLLKYSVKNTNIYFNIKFFPFNII